MSRKVLCFLQNVAMSVSMVVAGVELRGEFKVSPKRKFLYGKQTQRSVPAVHARHLCLRLNYGKQAGSMEQIVNCCLIRSSGGYRF